VSQAKKGKELGKRMGLWLVKTSSSGCYSRSIFSFEEVQGLLDTAVDNLVGDHCIDKSCFLHVQAPPLFHQKLKNPIENLWAIARRSMGFDLL